MKSKEVKEFRLGELFCGPGGLAYAAVNSQIEDSEYKIIHKWSNDYDLDTCKTYTRNICPNDPESVIGGDVRKLDIEPLGDIDALAFGFPCNDFSVVGEQKGFVNWNGSTYYVHENGALGLQWQELEEGCYYFDYTTAQMYTGWLKGDTTFYLDPDGKLHTGWLKLDGKQYYFYQAGDMATGKMTIGNGEYYFDENGVLQSGFAIPQAPSLYE